MNRNASFVPLNKCYGDKL